MDDLNQQQKLAAQAGDGPLVIIAGPGTGKTKTLIARLEFLVKSGVVPSHILALTFTKKAAEEMQLRFSKSDPPRVLPLRLPSPDMLAGVPAARDRGTPPSGSPATKTWADSTGKEPFIATFHALCFTLLKEKMGTTPDIITEPARLAIIKKITKPAEFKGASTRELSLLISRAKNMADDNPAAMRLVMAYNAELRAQNLYDFDDILVQTKQLLQQDTAWCAIVQKRFTHILVDEFQDTNALQYDLLCLIRGNKNVCVIGDPQQSIYGFRGADGDIFAKFLHDFPEAMQIMLTTNYRSAPQIVALANAVYPDAPQLLAHAKTPGVARTVEVLNEYSEANWVLAEIQNIIGGSDLLRAVSNDKRASQRSLRDIAVLYRSRNVARTVQKTLADSGIPVQIVGEGSPYDAPNVQTILQVLAQLFDPERVARIKDFTPGQVRVLIEKLDPAQPPHILAEQIITAFNIEPDAAIRQVVSVLVQHKTLADAVAYFDAIAAQDFYDPRAEAVTLLTIHAAKGLEFAQVFLIGAEDGVLPSERGNLAEEKRLFYVAVTRAKERLDILHARMRSGQKVTTSSFMTDLPATVLPRMVDPSLQGDQRRAQKRQAKRSQISLF